MAEPHGDITYWWRRARAYARLFGMVRAYATDPHLHYSDNQRLRQIARCLAEFDTHHGKEPK